MVTHPFCRRLCLSTRKASSSKIIDSISWCEYDRSSISFSNGSGTAGRLAAKPSLTEVSSMLLDTLRGSHIFFSAFVCVCGCWFVAFLVYGLLQIVCCRSYRYVVLSQDAGLEAFSMHERECEKRIPVGSRVRRFGQLAVVGSENWKISASF